MAYGMTLDGHLMGNTMAEVNDLSWGRDQAQYDSMKGVGGVGAGISISTPGAANAIYGPMLGMLAYSQHNTLAVLGEKPYRTGLREQVSLSLSEEDTTGIIRGGYITAPSQGTYAHIEMPYKLLGMMRPMTLGMMEIGDKNIDDVITWEQYFRNEGLTWTNNQNADLLRRIEDAPKVGLGSQPIGGGAITSTERVGLEAIERIISNYEEANALPDNYACPWVADPGYTGSDSAMGKYRNKGDANFVNAASNFDCYVDSHYDAGTTTGASTLRPLTIDMLDSLFMGVMPYWSNNRSGGKAVVTRYDTVQKIQGLLGPNQRFLGWEGVAFSVNGVNTVEGRGAGFQVATYNGVPLIPDLMVRGGTAAAPTTGVGRIYMINQNALAIGILRQPEVIVSDNEIMNGQYTRLAGFKKLAETQIQVSETPSFKSLGKIVHIS